MDNFQYNRLVEAVEQQAQDTRAINSFIRRVVFYSVVGARCSLVFSAAASL